MRNAGGPLSSLLWFGADYGPGDPLRWSPAAVEILLADWIPRKLIAEPELLRAYVRFCHAERGIRPALTEQTVAVVHAHEEGRPGHRDTPVAWRFVASARHLW